MVWFERKVVGRLQNRLGPNVETYGSRVYPFLPHEQDVIGKQVGGN